MLSRTPSYDTLRRVDSEIIRLQAAEIEQLRRIVEAARKVHFWNDSAEPYADLAFDDAMAELGKALEGEW